MDAINGLASVVRVNIGERALYLNCLGQGSPTVILEQGLGSTAEDFASIQPEVAKFTRVCSYNRAGLGKSDPAPIPRTCQDQVEDLHQLLYAAQISPPYVLVGHSWGGLNVQLYASQYPDEVAGMVLIDAVHEDRYIAFERCSRLSCATVCGHLPLTRRGTMKISIGLPPSPRSIQPGKPSIFH